MVGLLVCDGRPRLQQIFVLERKVWKADDVQQDNTIAMTERPRCAREGCMKADADAVEWDAVGEEWWCRRRFAESFAAAAAGRWIISDA